MPTSTDNQDYSQDPSFNTQQELLTKKEGSAGGASEKSTQDENHFTSDNQKGKKVDGDPGKESDQPADV